MLSLAGLARSVPGRPASPGRSPSTPAERRRPTGRRRRALRRRAPGRHRHRRAGPPALRVLRRHDHGPRRRWSACCKDWTAAARDMTAGRRVGGPGPPPGGRLAPPTTPARRVGLDAVPAHPDDRLRPEPVRRPVRPARPAPGGARRPAEVPRRHARPGPLRRRHRVQACADDPQVAVHAIRNLSRIAAGRAAVRWAQLGFGKASSTDTSGPTPRNLFGFKDGTANVLGNDTERAATSTSGRRATTTRTRSWMTGGSYLVSRRIRMTIETWDRGSLVGPGADRRPHQGRRRPVGREARARPDPSRPAARRLARRGWPTRHCIGGVTDAAPRLQLRRRRRRLRPPRRRAVLPRLPARPAHGVRADPARALPQRRDDGVPPPHRLGDLGVPPGVRADGWWGETLFTRRAEPPFVEHARIPAAPAARRRAPRSSCAIRAAGNRMQQPTSGQR